MLLFSDMLYMLVRYASPSGPMCVRCLMLTLASPVELLFLLCFITTLTWVVLVFCWLVRVLSSKEYVCCVCDPSGCLGIPSICQVCMRDV